MSGGFRGYSIGPPWCRQTKVPWTAIWNGMKRIYWKINTIFRLYKKKKKNWVKIQICVWSLLFFLPLSVLWRRKEKKPFPESNELAKCPLRQFQKLGSTATRLTHKNIFQILLNKTQIRFHLPFSDWFRTANGQCPLHGKYNLISVWFNKISKRFRKDFSVCDGEKFSPQNRE